MKRWIVLLLITVMLLSGCSSASDNTKPNDTIPADTTPGESGSLPSEESSLVGSVSMPMITVSVPVSFEETAAEDGTVIFRSIRQSIQLVMPDQEVADKIIIDFLSRIDQATAARAEILQQAQAAYVPSDNWVPYLCSISYAPKRIDQCVLSLYGNSLRFSGGVHAENASRAASYNVLTGDVLTLGSIIVDESSLDQLCALVIEKLQSVAEEKYLRDDFEESVKQRFAVEESYDENWYFSATGLCFYFDQYAIAPYSSGIITAEIPYSELIGVIDDAFFPPELDTTSGTVKTIAAEETDMTQFLRISEVILENEAPMHVIYTEGTVQNLRIILSDAVFNGEYTVFAAQYLSDGDAVVIQANTNMFRHLNIVYESSGQTFTLPLFTE